MKIYKINSFINRTRSLFINFYDANFADKYKEAQQTIKDHYSTSLITNLDGEIVQHVEYVPFGEVFIEERNNKWNTPYLFNAKELDEETGLYYYGARYYDPRVSLWLSADPKQEEYPNISTYAYCAQNPVKFVDLAGKDPKKINDWINFAIDLYNASTAVLSIGFQASANVDVSVAKVGVDANAGSVDLLGVREGVFTPGVNTPQISKGVELNVGVISFSTGITTTDTGISKIKENTISVGVSAFEFYQTETTETNNFTNKSTTTTESGVKAADLKFSASLVFGIELGLNTEKAATALYNLLKTE